jgi:hypothetical protein
MPDYVNTSGRTSTLKQFQDVGEQTCRMLLVSSRSCDET